VAPFHTTSHQPDAPVTFPTEVAINDAVPLLPVISLEKMRMVQVYVAPDLVVLNQSRGWDVVDTTQGVKPCQILILKPELPPIWKAGAISLPLAPSGTQVEAGEAQSIKP